jgi:metallo-beta-lactamase family protein
LTLVHGSDEVNDDDMSSSTLQFLGGVRTVTGSKFLVRSGASTILIDCGLFQGLRELRERNWEDPPISPQSLDAVILTHAHIDHCGYLPRLVAAGYRGPVYATAATGELARVVLPDCGHLNEEEAEYANRRQYSRHEPALPLYTEADAASALQLLRSVEYGTEREIAPDVHLTFTRAGHILGSAGVRLRLGEVGPVLFASGDLGRPFHPLLRPPPPPPTADCLLVESTYGDRLHDDEGALDVLASTIARTIDRGGNVLIPAFAVDRTEVLLYHLAALARDRRLPSGVPIYVDSPMALSALSIYREAIARGDADLRTSLVRGSDPFDVPGLGEVRDVEGSKALNHPDVPSIVISAAGMASGGRVVHHLAHYLPDSRNTVVLAGFQAEGTRGRQLLDGCRELKMLGRYVRVRATIVNLSAFSVHADARELLEWVSSAESEPDTVYVVHGETSASNALANSIVDKLDWSAVVPRLGERVNLRQL